MIFLVQNGSELAVMIQNITSKVKKKPLRQLAPQIGKSGLEVRNIKQVCDQCL